jgi:predicted metal-dependent TIM-barrel fold hydrolase
MAYYEHIGQSVWLKNFLLYDNEAAIFFSKNNKSSSASKWIDIKYLVVRDKVKNDTIVIQHINTKMLPPNLYKEHVTGMGLINEL